ncbi:MAG: DUF4163 domain-containing protein [Erythrobacter sp.]|jgi:hypothetical protein|nr:DUF4163 domain-containing protein [Erythrobacter sp.]
MLRVLLAGVCCGLAACSSPEDVREAVGGEPDELTLAVSSTGDPRPVHFEDHAEKDGGMRDFTYAWPVEASAILQLVQVLEAERDAALAEQKADWEEALTEFAGEDCPSCKARGFIKGWDVAANTPRFLALKGEISLYSGGAHPNSTFDALVWDREAGVALRPLDLFTSPAALEQAVRAPFCEALIAQQRDRRGEYFVQPDDPLAECPALEELVVVPASTGGAAIDEVRLLAAPYVAGAYAEGPYKVHMPVTDAVLAAVKEEYRAAFVVR